LTAEAAWLLAFLLIAVHSGLVAVAVALVTGPVLGLVALAAALELVSHFAIDLGRGRLMRRFPTRATPRLLRPERG